MSDQDYAYVNLFGKTRYCKVTKTDLAKDNSKIDTFTKENIYYIERGEDWYGWHHYKNKCAVALTRENWINGTEMRVDK